MELDADRWLALAYVPAAARPALDALWRLDVTLGAVVAAGRDPMMGRIRLAWWREALEALDRAPPPPEPVLRALAAQVLPGGVTGAALAAMEAGWAELLAEGPLDGDALERYAAERGGLLFRHSALLLGDSAFPVEGAGRLWALADLARRSSDRSGARAALAAAAAHVESGRWPRRLRPLGMLAALARRDLARQERPGAPARMLRMLRHRLTGN
jgi:phytoene synthase